MAKQSDKELIFMPNGATSRSGRRRRILPALDEMTPREIVAELDKYIVGQAAASAQWPWRLRNRVRRQKAVGGNGGRHSAEKYFDDLVRPAVGKTKLRGGSRGWRVAHS